MAVFKAIKKKLLKYPDLKYEQDDNSLAVMPEGGFTVSIYENETGYTVCLEGWHKEFSDHDDALNCFAFGLSDQCRLKILQRGRFPYKWTLQYLEGDDWVDDTTTGLMFFPFWRKKTVVYLQNNVIQD